MEKYAESTLKKAGMHTRILGVCFVVAVAGSSARAADVQMGYDESSKMYIWVVTRLPDGNTTENNG